MKLGGQEIKVRGRVPRPYLVSVTKREINVSYKIAPYQNRTGDCFSKGSCSATVLKELYFFFFRILT